ncbi:MAG: autotransporter-associated beta strand repeat-containing protein, partial [Candidatus Pacebacteria bacterium]|nr:autotransporter-associated beta strand repeat-containing protein [Candidatus Paceibacterota bacterium]
MSGSGYTLSGNRIILGQGLAGITDSASSGGNTIAFDIRLDVTRDIVVTNTVESLTISGRISGVGGINKEGTGTLILSGANTYGGITKINVGVINARNSTSLGSIALGTEVVGGAALEIQGDISIGYEALTLRGWGVSGTGGALRNVSGANTYGGLITLSSAGGVVIKSDSGTLTVTGGTTGNSQLIFDGSGDMVFSIAPIAGNATITKNGSGTVTYNFPNTNSGTLVINSGTIRYGVDNAILAGAVIVTGGTLDIATFSDIVGQVTLGTLDLASGTITGTTGMLSAASYVVYQGTISAIIAGNAATLTKSTAGTVTLTRANKFRGSATISAGILEIQDSLALGLIDGTTAVAAGGTLQINGSGLSIPEYISSLAGTGHLYTGAIRNKTGNNSLTGLITVTALTRIISDGGTTLTVDEKGLYFSGSANLTIGGEGNTVFTPTAPIYGTSGNLTKNDTGVLTIESFSNFAGTTNLLRGEVVLSGSGAIPGSGITIGSGGTLTLDNSSTTILDRISDTYSFTMNGGNFNFIGNASGAASETVGALTSTTGHNIVTVTPGSGGSTIMRFGSLSRSAGSSLLFRGTNLGSTPASGVSTIMFTSAPTVVGAGGSAGTSTASIIKGVFGDNSLSGSGSDMVVYNLGNTNGIRLLNSAGFSGEYAFTLATNANVKLSGNVAASTASINSLISNGYDITNASATITMASASLAGNILINSTNNIAGSNTTIGITTFELNILSTASSTISAVIGTAAAGSLAVSGPGNVTLSATNLFTGATNVNNATLTYGVSNALSTGGINVVGGTLDIAGNSDTVGAIVLQNGTITGGAGILSGSSYSFREGTVSAILNGSGNVTVVTTNAPVDAVVILTRDNTYTGTTTITSGILKLGAAGGSTNTPLGTTGGGTLIANGGALDLNGYTLGTSEPITSLAGTGFGLSGSSNVGAIMNSGAVASFSGSLNLTAAARINADAGALTISGNASGNFALTFGGFSNINYSGVRSGTSTIVKDGINTLTLSNGNSSYSGVTTISAGTVKIGAISVGGTNSPLGTAAGGTTVALGSRLDLNGFNLGIAEPITSLNGVGYGLGDFASGALMNSSATGVTFTGLITLGSASTIVVGNGDINLTAAGTISGAGMGLTLGGSGIGSLSSVIGTTSGQVIKIGTGTWTLSGQSTYTGATSINLGTLKIGANGGATNTPIGTSAGGVTVYSGAVLDFNGFTIPTAEALTINGFGINDSSVLIGSNGTFGGTIALASESGITNASGTMTITGAVSGAFLLHVDGAGNITTSAAFPTTGTSISKHGAGTLTVTGTNLYTGATRVEAGTFAYAATTTLAATPLTVLGGTFNNGANTDTIGTVTLVGGTIANSAALTATAYTLESGTISGILAGAVAVTKNTNNTVTLTGVNTISSTTTINAGTLVIGGSGSAVSTTITVNLGGTLTLDNSTTSVANRLGNALALSMNGGNFNFIGNGAGSSSETTGALTMLSGHNTVTVTPGSGGSTTMTFASFSRTAGATGLFRGTNFESTA